MEDPKFSVYVCVSGAITYALLTPVAEDEMKERMRAAIAKDARFSITAFLYAQPEGWLFDESPITIGREAGWGSLGSASPDAEVS